MARTLPRWPLVLLGVMTLLSFGGPVVIGLILRGGGSATWPPDRPIEWAVLFVISGLVAALMLACCGLALAVRKPPARPKVEPPEAQERGDRP